MTLHAADPPDDASMKQPRPNLPLAVVVALVCTCVTATGTCLALWGTGSAALSGIDFNAALFEDFLAPYWQTARNLSAADYTPAQGYLYPSTLAWLLTPLVWLQASLEGAATTSTIVPSSAAVGLVLGSLAILLGSVFALVPPRSLGMAAAAGVILGLAHAPVHGAYWAQASLPAIAGLSAGVALMQRDRPILAGFAIGLAAALKLHPIIGLLALVIPWRPAGASIRAASSAVLFAAASGVVLPLALMGRAAFVDFHRTIWDRLADMNTWVMTKEGGRGSQDLPVILGRFTPLESVWVRRGLGWLVGACLVAMAVRALRRSGAELPSRIHPSPPLAAFVFLAAIPWAAVSPTWPHGLLWVPVAWWLAAHSASRAAWCLGALSLAAGSTVALRLAGSPEHYAWYGLPAWSALLGVGAAAAAVFARSAPSNR